MKITDVKLTVVATPRHTGFISKHIIVELMTDEGIEGVGEMSDFSHFPKYALDVADLTAVLKGMMVGRNPMEINSLNKELEAQFPDGNEKAVLVRSGIDIALYDLCGKALNVPASDLLGGRFRERIKVCYPIFRHRFMEEVKDNLAVVRERLAEGFDVFRLYAGKNIEADEAFLDGVKREFGSTVKIKSIDFSQLLDWKTALRAIKRLSAYDFEMVESPASRLDHDGLRQVRCSIDRPVSEHVTSFKHMSDMIKYEAVDVFNITPVSTGGLTACKKAAAAAAVFGKSCLLGTTQELSIGTAAMAQLGATLENLDYTSDPTGPKLYTRDVVASPVRYENGYIRLPSRECPGIGMELDKAALERCAVPDLSWGDVSVHQVQDRTSQTKS